jgi:hypothetical protein
MRRPHPQAKDHNRQLIDVVRHAHRQNPRWLRLADVRKDV